MPIFYQRSTVFRKNINEEGFVSWLHGQSCPEIWTTDGSHIILQFFHRLTWTCLTLVLSKYQYFTDPRQFRKNIKRSFFLDDTENLSPRFRQLMAHVCYLYPYFCLTSFDSSSRIMDMDSLVPRFSQLMAHVFYCESTMVLPELVWFLSRTRANILPTLRNSWKKSNEYCFAMTRTILSQDSAKWWLMYSLVDLPWSRVRSFNSCPRQVPTFHRPSTVRERNQTKVVSRWRGQSCLKVRPNDDSRILLCIDHGFAWDHLTVVLSKYQHFTSPRQSEEENKRRLFRDDLDNLVPRFGQLMAHVCHCESTMILPELVSFLSWTRANILPTLGSSRKKSDEDCFAMTRTILSQDSAKWWLMYSLADLPWSRERSFHSYPEQVPTFYRPSTVRERNQTTVVSRWRGQSCPKVRPNDSRILLCIYHGFAWARLTAVLRKYQYLTGPRQSEEETKQRLLRDDFDNLVPRFGQTMAPAFYYKSTMVSSDLVWFLSWTLANILPTLDGSKKKSNKDCFAMTRTILSRDSTHW